MSTNTKTPAHPIALTVIHGPAATGKTLLARALETRLRFEGHTPVIMTDLDCATLDSIATEGVVPGHRRLRRVTHIIYETTTRPSPALLRRAETTVQTKIGA